MITRARGAAAIVGACLVAGLTSAPAQTTPAPAQAQTPPGQTPSPGGAKLYFINLKDGQEVTSPFLMQFGLSGMGVAPAGVEKSNIGHHHLLIDAGLSGDELKQPIVADDKHRHFGNGQIEAMITRRRAP